MKKQALALIAAATLTGGVLYGQESSAERARMEEAVAKLKAALRNVEPSEGRLGVTGAVVRNQPYSAEAMTETTQTLADGTHIHQQSSYTLYRDSEGRMRRESGGEAVISDPVAGVSYSLNIRRQTARAMPLVKLAGKVSEAAAKEEARRLSVVVMPGENPEKKEASVENLGTQVIEGVPAEGTRTTVTIPPGSIGNDRAIQIVSERWYSPELQIVVMTRHSDPRNGETIYRLTNIRRTQPDQALFEVPAGYQTVTAKD
jgi:hypothetical protein